MSAARRICASVAPATPKAIFPARVSLNRNVSCGTSPICRRKSSGSYSRMSCRRTGRAPLGSISRAIRLTSVVCRCRCVRQWPPSTLPRCGETPSRAVEPSNTTATSRNSISPRASESGRALAGAAMCGVSSIISSMRASEAVPRCVRFTTQPSAIMGQTSMPM